MSIINSNLRSLVAQQAMVVNGRQLSDAMSQLATGRRINSSADDAAGLAIGNKLNSQVISLAQAVRNAGDGVSLMQTADGAADEITNMLVRMRELAVQSRNGTNSAGDQTALNTEYTALRTQIQQITTHTQWNGMKIIGGDKATVSFHVGASDNDQVQVQFKNLWASGIASGVSATDILSAQAIDSAIGGIDLAMGAVDEFRSSLGAVMNRLNHAADNAMNVMTNTAASRSRIMDTDYAKATSALARAQIVQQAGMAMLSQANQTPRTVLMLLR
jgi:flagellin